MSTSDSLKWAKLWIKWQSSFFHGLFVGYLKVFYIYGAWICLTTKLFFISPALPSGMLPNDLTWWYALIGLLSTRDHRTPGYASSPTIQARKNTTHLFTDPVVAGFRQYSSKYRLTRRSLSSTEGNPNSTISSTRSLMAQSNWSGWLLAKTNINLQGKQNKIIMGFVADSAEFVFILFFVRDTSLLELQYHSGTFLATPTRCKLMPTRFTDLKKKIHQRQRF